MIDFDPQTLAFSQKNGEELTAKLTCTLLADRQVLVLNHIFINPAVQNQTGQLGIGLVKAALSYAQEKQLKLWPLGPAALAACQSIPAVQARW
ncbi:MAG: N-acetyltransferase [Lactobacillus sp.]|jgi:hypothetical protein|nr:N-acetyltransferase [Lactobacillus sp.]MCH3990505.1 N-acetyltransferase [Lactobacillus sp.]MCH4068780.1 N-acetyltransferase [Lactobacillus sp.]MCI1303735.1 N-acetyltransferase [Lactobacillus sp.]MCI1330119.1 N-acetyltransferase [Lactobacillus sp.]